MSLGAIILLIVLWFRLQPELYSLLMIVLFGLKCGRGGRADSWMPFETYTVNPGWKRGTITKNHWKQKDRDCPCPHRVLPLDLLLGFPLVPGEDVNSRPAMENKALRKITKPVSNGFFACYCVSQKHCENP